MLIWLKKYLNPHENSCSKVISILTAGNILHESSSAPRQHKSVQYKWFTLYLHRDVSHTDMLQLHFISCRGVSGGGGGGGGRRQHARIQGFLSVLVSPQLILQFTEGVQWFYCCENYTYTLPRIQRGSIIFQGGGGGPNANFFRNPCTYLLFSRGGGVRTPYPPLDPHMGNVIITGQYLSQSRF